MTNKQAIYNLKQAKCIPYKHETPTYVIQALQADGDLISRQATINGVPKLCNGIACAECPFESINDVCKIKEWLSFLPSVDIPQDHDGCKDCRYQAKGEDELPCRECKQNYMDKWKAIPSAESNVGHCEECKHFQKLPLHTDAIGKCVNHWGFCPKGDWYCADFETQESEE